MKDHFAVLLAFDRSPDSSTDELGEWWRAGYSARNQLVHQGKRPDAERAANAVGTATTLVDEVIDRIYRDVRFAGIFPARGPVAP